MKKNRFLRSPFIWIVLAFLAIVLIFDAIGNAGGYAQKPTSEVVALINGDTPLTEVVLVDGDLVDEIAVFFKLLDLYGVAILDQ